MKYVDGSVYLSQISIPGTHDTLTFNATPVAQDQDNSFTVPIQLVTGIRFFDLRLKGDTLDAVHGVHGPVDIPHTDFWPDIIAPTIQFLQKNPSECVIYMISGAETVMSSYMQKYGPRDTSWGGFYTSNAVPTLDQVRGKIILVLPYYDKSYGWGLDFTSLSSLYDAYGSGSSSLTASGKPVTLYGQQIYDDQYKGDKAAEQTDAIQKNISAASKDDDPSHWYVTCTSRASGAPSSRQFALGPLLPPYPPNGYNTVALAQINTIPISKGPTQPTVGIVYGDFPNCTPGYIPAIYMRNRTMG
ncbi:hypothetical protein [Streptomyces sp. 900105245]